ncbi:MAG TPA: DUF6051 family protein [Spirochaetia bacterium]|nr:DUF6051 family protein [Spirochaetia bacterium]
MPYFDDRARLSAAFSTLTSGSSGSVLSDDSIEITRFPFSSAQNSDLFAFEESLPEGFGPNSTHLLAIGDPAVQENFCFDYFVVRSASTRRSTGAIFLFHGLNEKSWDKYLPWAKLLALRTGKAVMLFPIAFHMNRAPAEWSNPRAMMRVAAERRAAYPGESSISFVNAALSSRLQFGPQRLFSSGLQTYDDVVALVDQLRSGSHPLFVRSPTVDFFGYSIGAFLTEILLMQNPGNLFGSSRAVLFCGGTTLGSMSPVSRFIMDGEASRQVAGYYGSQLQGGESLSGVLRKVVNRMQSLGTLFLSMLFNDKLKGYRDAQLASVGNRLQAIALRQDRVMPAPRVAETLEIARSSARVTLLDFPFPYTHEQPFPLLDRFRTEIDEAFELVFRRAALTLS